MVPRRDRLEQGVRRGEGARSMVPRRDQPEQGVRRRGEGAQSGQEHARPVLEVRLPHFVPPRVRPAMEVRRRGEEARSGLERIRPVLEKSPTEEEILLLRERAWFG